MGAFPTATFVRSFVRPPVRPSVRLSVCLSVCPESMQVGSSCNAFVVVVVVVVVVRRRCLGELGSGRVAVDAGLFVGLDCRFVCLYAACLWLKRVPASSLVLCVEKKNRHMGQLFNVHTLA